jgi:hypothetical protein
MPLFFFELFIFTHPDILIPKPKTMTNLRYLPLFFMALCFVGCASETGHEADQAESYDFPGTILIYPLKSDYTC